MNERKDRLVENLANTVAINEENNFKAQRIALAHVFQKMGDKDKLQNEIDELKKENERTSPLPYDEEEAIIYEAYKNKKK